MKKFFLLEKYVRLWANKDCIKFFWQNCEFSYLSDHMQIRLKSLKSGHISLLSPLIRRPGQNFFFRITFFVVK